MPSALSSHRLILCTTLLLALQGCFFRDTALENTLQTQQDAGMSVVDMAPSLDMPDQHADALDMVQDQAAADLPDIQDITTAACEAFKVDDDTECVASACDLSQATCDARAREACTTLTFVRDEEACTLGCVEELVTMCQDDDGCCPPGCDESADRDCEPELFEDACGIPVRASQLQSKAVVITSLTLEEECCADLDQDGLIDNGWVDYMLQNPALYNDRIAEAIRLNTLNILWRFEAIEHEDDFEDTMRISQRVGDPRCMDLPDGVAPTVYAIEQTTERGVVDDFTLGKSLPTRLSATSNQVVFPLFGLVPEDVVWIPLRDARINATLDNTTHRMTGGSMSGHVVREDLFGALDEYFANTCSCHGDHMFEFSGDSITCNDLSAHTCDPDTECFEYVGYCSFVTDHFTRVADFDPLNTDQACVPNNGMTRGTCDALSVGLTFETERAYLLE